MKAMWGVLAIFAAAGGWGSSSAASLPGQENTACESVSPGGDFVQFTCALAVSAKNRYWRFKADFAGGHDDTSASMTLTLDDAPLDCLEGSKTRLFGEDGNVSLVCHFRTLGTSGRPPTLGVSLLWSHAQYVRTELVEEGGRP